MLAADLAGHNAVSHALASDSCGYVRSEKVPASYLVCAPSPIIPALITVVLQNLPC